MESPDPMMAMNSKTIFVLADWYEPGFKAGGPIRSCVNFVRNMSSDYRIYVFTSDRDLGSSAPYPGVPVDQWLNPAENIHLYYCSPGNLKWGTIRRQLELIGPDFIYLNSMFSPKFTIYPLLINRLRKAPAKVVLAPRGMLKDTAIQFKRGKKMLFLSSLRRLGLHRRIHFHVSDETEKQEVGRYFGTDTTVTRVPNFPSLFPDNDDTLEKRPGELSIVFVGRIHPIKNLDYLLSALGDLRFMIRLTIIGSIEDEAFWEKCRKIIDALPSNIRVVFEGERPHHELPPLIGKHHIFSLPTQGENFGHAIFEAMALGKPVLISDQTPWKDLEKMRVGWDLPLNRPELFRRAIGTAAAFSQEEYDTWSDAARRYARDYVSKMNLTESYRLLFS